MTGSSPGTPSPAAASGGGGSNNNNSNNQRNNNNNNKNNQNNSAASAAAILQKITENKVVFIEPKNQKVISDFQLTVEQLGAVISMETGLTFGPHIGKCIVNDKMEPLKAPTRPTRIAVAATA